MDIAPTLSRSISVDQNGQRLLPDEIFPFKAQIAGHGSLGDGQRVFLKHENGHLLKPLQAPPKRTRETGFYDQVFNSGEDIDKELSDWVPKCYGIKTFDLLNQDGDESNSTEEDYLILDDVTKDMILPSIMDIKIGSQTFGPDAPEAKRAQEDSKYKGTKKPLGFSILGIIVHPLKGSDRNMQRFDKSFGQDIKTEEVLNLPKTFFSYSSSGVVKDLVEIVIKKLEAFYKVYDKQRKYHIYGSSLLFAYDAKVARNFVNGQANLEDLEKAVNIKLIDFAHVFPAADGARDDNFLRGLTNLIKVFQDYLHLDDDK